MSPDERRSSSRHAQFRPCRLDPAPLADVVGWAEQNVASILCSCLATHALLRHFHGIDRQPLPQKQWGVYSHRIGDTWLAGGASNSGGSIYLTYFKERRREQTTTQLQLDSPTGLDYYPLTRPGERFPRNDPEQQPRLEPRPDNDVQFFQAMLEGIAEIEAEGYRTLSRLGAPALTKVFTAGGGSSVHGMAACSSYGTYPIPVQAQRPVGSQSGRNCPSHYDGKRQDPRRVQRRNAPCD